MVKVAAATSAAPTYFKPVKDGYIFADGGVWANNPIMIGLVEALSSFKTKRSDISILSIGCGETPYTLSRMQRWLGGKLAWSSIIFGAMRFQSMNAVGQAGLLIGRDRIIRVDPPMGLGIDLDDWKTAAATLPEEARNAITKYGEQIASTPDDQSRAGSGHWLLGQYPLTVSLFPAILLLALAAASPNRSYMLCNTRQIAAPDGDGVAQW